MNVGLWFLFAVLVNFAESRVVLNAYDALTLTPSDVVPGLELWQVATYAWLHDLGGLSHILFNALGLYFLGTTLERRWGGKTFLKFFLLTGLIAGVVSVLVGLVIPRFDVGIVAVTGEGRAGRGGHVEEVHDRHGAVVARADGHALRVEDGAQVVRMHALERE